MEEKNIVRMVMIILFLSLSFVYGLYFFLNRDKITTTEKESPIIQLAKTIKQRPSSLSGSNNEGIVGTGVSNQDILDQLMRNRESQQGTGQNASILDEDFLISPPHFRTGGGLTTRNTGMTSEKGTGTDDIWSMIESMKQAIPSLSGTKPFLGPTLISQTLGVQPFASFQDDVFSETFYLFLGNEEQSFSSETQKLGGTTFRLTTQADILTNGLIGDDIVFINIPGITYEQNPTITRKIVFMYLWYRGGARLIQTPFNTRPRFKKRLVEMFNEL